MLVNSQDVDLSARLICHQNYNPFRNICKLESRPRIAFHLLAAEGLEVGVFQYPA
jgi:hypothetical protein